MVREQLSILRTHNLEPRLVVAGKNPLFLVDSEYATDFCARGVKHGCTQNGLCLFAQWLVAAAVKVGNQSRRLNYLHLAIVSLIGMSKHKRCEAPMCEKTMDMEPTSDMTLLPELDTAPTTPTDIGSS